MKTLERTGLIRKVSTEGVGYSVVELNDVRHIFAAAVPRKGETLEQQADDALKTIAAVVGEEGKQGSIVHQAVFYSDPARLAELQAIIREFYGSELPATSYVPQHPCDGKLLAIEALGVGRGFGEVQIERRNERVVVTRHNDISWIHCGQIMPRPAGGSVYDRSIDCFQQMRDVLTSEGVRFDQVIRTWLYLGDIVGPDSTSADGSIQRYMELNRARTDFYQGVRFGRDLAPVGYSGDIYPASTGIGSDNGDIAMSAIAFATTRGDIVAVPLENPRQTPAFDYAAIHSPKSPKFSRAMALSCGRFATMFISGTASIINSETQHVGNAAAQTHETLDNIAALISKENLARHGLPGHGTSLDGLACVRVYIKRQEDYAATREVCRQRLGELPAIFAIADVCRPNLLVEIEGIAVSSQDAGR